MSSGNGSKKVKVPYKFNTVQLNTLKAHPKQVEVRQITDEALTGLGNFIDKVGLVEEIAINSRTGHIISGHQRCKILIDKGYSSARVKVFDVDEDTEDLMFTNLNSQAISGAFTDEAKPWVQSLEARLGSELYQDVGLQMLEVSLADPAEVVKDGLTDPDDVPETPKVAKSKTGDLYQLGNHRLLCGDATKKEDVERLLSGDKPFMMVTDPPYGVNYDPDWRNRDLKGKVGRARSLGKIKGDDRDSWAEAWELFSGDVIYLWSPVGNKQMQFYSDLAKCGFEIRTQIVWAKQHFVIGRGAYHVQHEPCWYAVRKGKKAHWSGDRSQSTVWQIANACAFGGQQDDVKTYHGTQKPVECMARSIRNHGKKGDGIYDPFLGSGTTMIACEQLDRKCYGIEIEPLYVDVCLERWAKFTGRDPVREDGKNWSELRDVSV